MTQPIDVTVYPSLPKLALCLALLPFFLAGVLWSAIGVGMILYLAFAAAALLSTASFVAIAVRRRSRVVINKEGFAFHKLFGELAHSWEEIDGPFAVIKIGRFKGVAYKLTPEYKARLGRKTNPRFSGYDEVILGDFQLSPEALAELLNQRLSSTSFGTGMADIGAGEPMATPAPSTEPEGNGNPVLRVCAGILALAIAGVLCLMVFQGELGAEILVGLVPLMALFGWFAVCGRKGLPGFYNKKLGS